MFFLEKHYFDAVRPDGSVCIVYDASLRVTGLPWTFRYASRLLVPAAGEPVLAHWTAPAAITGMAETDPGEPIEAGATIAVRLPDGAASTWAARQAGWPREILLDDKASKRFIAWQCRSPSCDVDLADASTSASGYVETLWMHLPRPRIPIDRLHWGRFTSRDHSLVWIIWEGPEPRRLAWLDGRRVEIDGFETPGAGELRIRVPGGDLESEPCREIVARPIDSRLTAAMGWCAAILPRGLRNLEERKTLGRGRLRLAPHLPIEGWTLSETLNLKAAG